MKRYIITGTSGSGKTSIICALEAMGYAVAHEAATDIIEQEQAQGIKMPWRDSTFVDKVAKLQGKRESKLSLSGEEIQFFDRAIFDEHAFCLYMERDLTPYLLHEIERIQKNKIYNKKVFFVENLGFCKETSVRQISYEEALRFEKIHEDVYGEHGYELIRIKPDNVKNRVNNILSFL